MELFLLAVVGSAFLESGCHMTTDSPHRSFGIGGLSRIPHSVCVP